MYLIIQLVVIIMVLEIVDFILSYILPKNRLKGAYENAINMIIFSFIMAMCVSAIISPQISIFSLRDIIWTQDAETYEFDEYVKIYKQLILNALE